jgi:hypothetical protein
MCEGTKQGLVYEVGGNADTLRKDSYEMQKQIYSYDSDKMFRFRLGEDIKLNLVNGTVVKGLLTMIVNNDEPLIEIDNKKSYSFNQIKGNPFIYTSLENFFVIEKEGHMEE